MSFVVIIPARYASTRLPGKPLVDINGKPMIVHVLERARESGAERIIVATDHEDVARAVEAAGGEVCMTRADHQSGTERLAEVVEKCAFSDDTVIVNVQGDEPMIPATIIRQVADNLAQRQVAAGQDAGRDGFGLRTQGLPGAGEGDAHAAFVLRVALALQQPGGFHALEQRCERARVQTQALAQH